VKISVLALVLALGGVCFGDTFTNRQTGAKLHGYAMSQAEDGRTNVHTQEKGVMELNPAEWEITRDESGRNNKVVVLPVEEAIMLEIETDAFEKALAAAADSGPLFILIEMDTPGGRIDMAQRMCAAITKTTDYCNVIAFVRGGQYGGAISAGAAVALACDKIYMAKNTVIGAASLVSLTKSKEENKDKSYTDVIDEKFSSLWRAYLASLAQQNDRPGLLARAMVDNDIEVIEVKQSEKRLFIEPTNKTTDQQLVRTWSTKGSLLTLTAEEAVDSTIADGLVSSREELLGQLQAGDAEMVVDKSMEKARREMDIVRRQLEGIRKSLDMKMKQAQYPQPAPKALGILRGAREEFETLISMAKKYPDLKLDVAALEDELNSVNANFERIMLETKRRK